MTTETKLVFCTAAELSEAICENIEIPGVFLQNSGPNKGCYQVHLTKERFDIMCHERMVVEAMREKRKIFELAADEKRYRVKFAGYAYEHKDPGIAIGLAALRAVGVEFELAGELAA